MVASELGKWFETSDLTMVVLKVFSTILVVVIWPIDFAILGLYTVGIIPFWYIKFKKPWTFFFTMIYKVKIEITVI